MSDQNAPSWLTQDDTTNASSASADKSPKPAGVFKMFSKEAATAHVQKAAINHATTTVQHSIATAPDDGFTPAWATSKAYTPPHDVENPAITPAASATASGDPKPSERPPYLELDPELEKRMLFYHRVLRILYQLASSFMATSAGISLIGQKNISSAFFAIYVLFFCTLMFCFEIGFSMIASCFAVNFGFLYTLTGRIVFVVFVGVMSFSLNLFGIIAMAVLFAVLLFHMIIMCMLPKFARYVREKDLKTVSRRA